MVLNLCQWDHANFAYDNMMSLRSVGVDCHGMKLEPHAFGYPQQLPVKKKWDICQAAANADVVQIFHSSRTILNVIRHLRKKTIVYHCSSDYRSNPTMMNSAFNPYVERSVLCLGEFWGLGAKNPVYMIGGIDCTQNAQNARVQSVQDKKTIFAHYPSNHEIKGTTEILNAFNQANVDLICSTIKVNSEEQLERMNQCDVYVELFKPQLHGRPYGSFGITALEAAAMGKIVVTQCLTSDLYEQHYGELPFFCVENYSHLVGTIRHISKLDRDQVTELQKQTRMWFERNHGYESTGKYLINNVL